jgi:hypothetical protein
MVILENVTLAELIYKFRAFKQSECSLLCLQQPTISPYLQPAEPNSYPSIPFL